MQFCAECGNEMETIHDTVHLKCCTGIGYWSKSRPTDGVKLSMYKGYYLYRNIFEWPNNLVPILPKLDTIFLR